MTPLPLHLETLSAGFAALTPGAREFGTAAARAAAEALSAELGAEVTIDASPSPALAAPAVATTVLAFQLAAPGAQVALDVDARLASGLAAILCGGDGDVAPARSVVPAERAAVELLALVALDGAWRVEKVAALAPRLVRDVAPARGALAVELAIRVGTLCGRARAVVSPAVLALAAGLAGEVPDVHVGAGLLRGSVSLSPEDAAALAPGDVALLDAGDAGEALCFAGGLVLGGRLDGDDFTVEERTMNEWNGSFPVALSVEVARVTVALRDLAGLAPGGVLPLNVARDGRVTLRAGEVVVGRGELVEVDGALAVRIASWDPSR